MSDTKQSLAPRHGGDLIEASKQHGIALADWMDLSTGINPDGYPIPEVPEACFHRLPLDGDVELQIAAKNFYGADSALAGAGSQSFIALLPTLRKPCRVAIPDVGYAEHAWQWHRHGHEIIAYSGFHPAQLDTLIRAEEVDVAVLINPNNPSTATVSVDLLEQWRSLLVGRGGWLILDEAFMDAMKPDIQDELSLTRRDDLRGVVILRSLGKFFGLAGLRVGFAIGDAVLLQQLATAQGPWTVSGVSQYIASKALSDRQWQSETRTQLQANSDWQASFMRECFPDATLYKSPLFLTLDMARGAAERVHSELAARAVYTRIWYPPDEQQALLRFGLVSKKREGERSRLVSALNSRM